MKNTLGHLTDDQILGAYYDKYGQEYGDNIDIPDYNTGLLTHEQWADELDRVTTKMFKGL